MVIGMTTAMGLINVDCVGQQDLIQLSVDISFFDMGGTTVHLGISS